jgi:hypothetical protein
MAKHLMNGKFSLYETDEGGFHIAYNPEGGEGETQHLEIPAMVVRMARASAEGKLSPLGMMKMMMGSDAK